MWTTLSVASPWPGVRRVWVYRRRTPGWRAHMSLVDGGRRTFSSASAIPEERQRALEIRELCERAGES